MYKALGLGLLVSFSALAADSDEDCYQSVGLSAPIGNEYILLIDRFDIVSIDNKQRIENWISKLKPNDWLYIYAYNTDKNPEIKTFFSGRKPVENETIKPSEKIKADDIPRYQEVFEKCVLKSQKLWAINEPIALLKAVNFSAEDVNSSDDLNLLQKMKLFTSYLINNDKKSTHILWVSRLEQNSTDANYFDGGMYSVINPQEEILKQASLNSIGNRNFKNAEITLFNNKASALIAQNKKGYDSQISFWKSYFNSLNMKFNTTFDSEDKNVQ